VTIFRINFDAASGDLRLLNSANDYIVPDDEVWYVIAAHQVAQATFGSFIAARPKESNVNVRLVDAPTSTAFLNREVWLPGGARIAGVVTGGVSTPLQLLVIAFPATGGRSLRESTATLRS
jgi:hypothetical protein